MSYIIQGKKMVLKGRKATMKKFKRVDGCTGNANEECQFFFSFGVGQFGNEQVKSCSYLDGKASDS